MTDLSDALRIPDTQSAADHRRIAIQRVGIRGVRYPLQLKVGDAVLATVADWSLDVALPAEQKGTHMSRFVAWLDDLDEPLDGAGIARAARRMLALLNAAAGRVEAGFPFFLRKRAPVSGVQSLLEYRGRWIVEADAARGETVFAEVVVPVKRRYVVKSEGEGDGVDDPLAGVTPRRREEGAS